MAELPVEAFTIYYSNGSVVEGLPEHWRTAPSTGVQAVIWWHAAPYRTLDANRNDSYRLPGQPANRTKTGSTIPDAEYLAIWERVQQRLRDGR